MPRTSLALLVVAGLAGRAAADPQADARAHIEKAAAHYGAGEFAAALVELDAAYALDPQPGVLYSIAQVHVKLERCGEAITFYARFLDSGPEARAKAAAEEAIAACKTKLAAAQPAPAPEPTPAAPPIAQPEPERPAGPRAWYADPIGGALVGAGLVSGIASIVFYVQARGNVDDAETAMNYDASEALMDDARSKRTYAAIAGVAGIALVGAGVVRYVMVRGRSNDNIAITPTTDGAAVTWSGRF